MIPVRFLFFDSFHVMNKRNLNIIKKDLLIITDPSILQIKDFSFQDILCYVLLDLTDH